MMSLSDYVSEYIIDLVIQHGIGIKILEGANLQGAQNA